MRYVNRAWIASQLADRPLGDELVGALPQRMQAIHERLHQQHVGGTAGLDHLDDLGDAEAERFLAQHVLPGRGCALGPLGVEVVGQRDVHRLDHVVGEHVVVRTVAVGDPEL